jgi:hypothetical protein
MGRLPAPERPPISCWSGENAHPRESDSDKGTNNDAQGAKNRRKGDLMKRSSTASAGD